MRWLAIAVVACSAPAARAPAPHPEHVRMVPVRAACPEWTSEHADEWPWVREVFPGCPPPPFRTIGVNCDGGACPSPCRETIIQPGTSATTTAVFHYDDAGRWKSSRFYWNGSYDAGSDARRPADAYCTHDADGSGTCRVVGDDPYGRAKLRTQATLRYDDEGHVISLEEASERPSTATYTYQDGRLAIEQIEQFPGSEYTTYRYAYDDEGRVSRVQSDGWGFAHDIRYRYAPDTDQAIAITMDEDHEHWETTVVRDDRGRPTDIATVVRAKGVSDTHYDWAYQYDCALEPFDGAITALQGLDARACACSDKACATGVTGELDPLLRAVAGEMTYADPTDAQLATYSKLQGEASRCLARLR